MKKNFYSGIAAIVLFIAFSFTSQPASALRLTGTPQRVIQQNPRDTPYLAVVRIYTGTVDTPYLSFSVDPQFVYSQVSAIVSGIPGMVQVVISFLNKEGALIDEEEYYFNNHG